MLLQRSGRHAALARSAHDCAATARDTCAMTEFIIPLDALGATDPERVGPKAANLAALARAGLPTPGGFCLTADAYRHQLAHLQHRRAGRELRRRAAAAAAPAVGRDQAQALRGADRAGDPRAAARRLARAARGERAARRDPLLRADRGSRRRQLRRPVRELPRHRRRSRIPHRRARLLGGAVDLATRAATWRTTASIRPTPRWRC